MSRRNLRPPPGIEVRHQHGCATGIGKSCDCRPKYRAIVRTPGEGKLQKTFATVAAAKQWRQDVQVDLRRGAIGRSRQTVREAADEWLRLVHAGTIRNRSGNVYKPSAIRRYEQALRDYVLPALGGRRMAELHRGDVQHLVDELVGKGLSASTVRNALLPLRAIARRALRVGGIAMNQTLGLELPAYSGKRDRVATPAEARLLLDALPEADRALWATARYAGLRLGELQALRWTEVDLKKGVIRVDASWDRREGRVLPKSQAGVRQVPIISSLRRLLSAHQALGGDEELVFGRGPERPFSPAGVVNRAHRVWNAQGLKTISPHECRHTFATLAIAAGVNIKALQSFMGHASITVTLDLYGHLLPGSEEKAAQLIQNFLDSSG